MQTVVALGNKDRVPHPESSESRGADAGRLACDHRRVPRGLTTEEQK
jgi:hypothetical protein